MTFSRGENNIWRTSESEYCFQHDEVEVGFHFLPKSWQIGIRNFRKIVGKTAYYCYQKYKWKNGGN